MTTKHTPAPWHVDEDHDVVDDRGITVADVKFATRGRLAEIKANARLIAAAPELLEACWKAEGILNAYIPAENFDGHASAALRAVRDAIAKATGG